MGAAAAIAGGVAVAGLGGSLLSASASKSAASQQASAQEQAAQLQEAQFQQTEANLAPYNQAGQNNLPLYQTFYGTSADQLGTAFNNAEANIPQPMTMANLVNTPGYQFQMQQGQRSVANSNAAQGLGVSGSALQGAANYATGLANSNYETQFGNQQQIYNDYLSQLNAKQNSLQTIYSQLGAPVSLGESAAATTGNIGETTGANVGNAIAQAGIAQSAGTTGSANALAGGLNSIGNAGLNYLGIQNALNNSGGGGAGAVDSDTSTF